MAARLVQAVCVAILAAWACLGSAAEPSLQPLPAVAPPASHQSDLASRTIRLVQERRWSDVVSMCEPAARKGTLPPDLKQRYDLAKIHCDIARRHTEIAYRTRLSGLSELDASRVYGEVLGRIG